MQRIRLSAKCNTRYESEKRTTITTDAKHERMCVVSSEVQYSYLLSEVVGVKKRLFFLVIECVGRSVLGRAREAYGRKVELAQFALPRQQTTSENNFKISDNSI